MRSEHGRAEHPTQKPIGIVEQLMLYSCSPGGAVLDLFAGSGTTGVVAQRHGFDALLVESKPEFAALAHRLVQSDGPLLQELNPTYFADGCAYVQAMADEKAMPDLFGLADLEIQPAAAAAPTRGEV